MSSSCMQTESQYLLLLDLVFCLFLFFVVFIHNFLFSKHGVEHWKPGQFEYGSLLRDVIEMIDGAKEEKQHYTLLIIWMISLI